MDLVDDSGSKIGKRMSKQEVVDVLKTLRPVNAEQERILAVSLGLKIEELRKRRMGMGLEKGFGGTFMKNKKRRADNDGYTDQRSMRLIAEVPREMLYVAQQVWGDDVLTDPVKFKQAFVKDELGQYCLTVDPKTI